MVRSLAMDALISPCRRRLMLGALGGVVLAGCQPPRGSSRSEYVQFGGATMGSTYSVKLHAAGRPPERLAAAVRDALHAVDARMSLFRADSELSVLNRARTGDAVAVSPELFAVLDAAQHISRWSDGAFDVTVAPLVEAWGFGVDPHRSLPPPERVAQTRPSVDWRALQLDATRRAVTKLKPHMRIDLGGIAQGYGVDCAAHALDELGIDHYLINVSGEVRSRGVNPDGHAWRIGIEEPDAMPQRARHVVPLADRGMATSGDYRIYFVADGRRYSHEIDPATGSPIAHGLCSVTVVAADCMQADAMATALIVAGPERGHTLAEASGVAAQFIVRTPDGLADRMTTAFTFLGAVAAT
jgi:thiamine biosynthesis lipoprotein